jgi:putative tricarboxylic transport membrane protein
LGIFDNLILGFSIAGTPANIFFCFVGVLVGTLIGVLPGIGAVATMAMLLPATLSLPPVSSLIMLAGIYYGAQYGGSTTAILVRMPGEASSLVTVLDGYAMAQRGRAGAALAIAAIASFVAGTVSTLLVAVMGPTLGQVALQFAPADYFALMVLGLVGSIVLASGSLFKAAVMILVGVLLGLVGTDPNSPLPRMSFDIPALAEGINFVCLAVGIFGISEILVNLEREIARPAPVPLKDLLPNRAEMREATPAIARGTIIGSLLGVLPGSGPLLASFAAYTVEKKISKTPERFGNGAIAGVASPEAANNAGAQTSFIPLLTLGIPSNTIMAVMAGAMAMQGIAPGPHVMTKHADLFWGMIASMWIGNLLLVILNLPLIGIWVKLLQVPYRVLYPVILVFCCIGVYSINNAVFDVYLTIFFGVLGYLLVKLRFEAAPLLLGVVLGPLMEENLKRAMLLSRGDPMVFLQRPLSLTLLVVAAALLAVTLLPALRKRREEVFQE